MLLVAQTWTSASNSSTVGSLCKGVYGRFHGGGSIAPAASLVDDGYGRYTATLACTFDQKYRNTTVHVYAGIGYVKGSGRHLGVEISRTTCR